MKNKVVSLVFFLSVSLLLLNIGSATAQTAYVGVETCRGCHTEYYENYVRSVHGLKTHPESPGAGTGCESCHGPGAAHAQSGDKNTIFNPARSTDEKASSSCLVCHADYSALAFWKGSPHAAQNVGCPSCHNIHTNPHNENLLRASDQKEVCLSCHMEIRSSLLKRSKHPMRDSSRPSGEGKMNCSSCHNPHGSQSDKLISARSVNDKCYECHLEKKAPVLWEHSPVKENCLVCHAAHGSSNDKLLVTMVPRLCQQCHLQGRHQSGTFPGNSVFLFNRACLNCHPMVHGSNNPSGPVLQR